MSDTLALHLMADISDPGSDVIAGTDLEAFAFYTGGDTPHAWTEAQIGRQTLRWAVPVWVYGAQPGQGGGIAEGQDAAATLRQLGVPRGVAIRVDMESSVDVPYLRGFRSSVDAAGYWYGVYGSAATVFGNPHGGAGWWVADWIGHPYDYPHSSVWATQYATTAQDGEPWDLSELENVHHCWDRQPSAGPEWVGPAAKTAEIVASDATALAAALKLHQ